MKRRRYHSLDDAVPRFVRERILLWIVTPFPTVVALLLLYDLLDGRTKILTNGETTLWQEPTKFAQAGGVCALFCIVTALLWLALIRNWDEKWLPPGLRDLPHLIIVALIFLTCGALMTGRELLTGEIILSGRGTALIGRHLSVDDTPIRFALFCGVYVACCSAIALGWYLALRRWAKGPQIRWKPTFDDPSKRARFK